MVIKIIIFEVIISYRKVVIFLYGIYNHHINYNKHIIPYVGNTRLAELSPEMLDNLFGKLVEKGLSQTSIKYTQRVLSVSLEAARKYHLVISAWENDCLVGAVRVLSDKVAHSGESDDTRRTKKNKRSESSIEQCNPYINKGLRFSEGKWLCI